MKELLRLPFLSGHEQPLRSLFLLFFLIFSLTSCKEDPVDIVTLSSISVSQSPDKVTYSEGDALVLSGLVVELLYSDNSERLVPYSDFEEEDIVTDLLDGSILGGCFNSITITQVSSGKSVSQIITIDSVDAVSLTVATVADRVSYYEGDALELGGLSVTIGYNNGSSNSVGQFDFESLVSSVSPSAGSPLSLSDTLVSLLLLGEDGLLSASFDITVLAVEITDISILTLPDKVAYYAGSALALEGLSVTINYNNGSSEHIGYSSFEGKGLITVPEEGSVLSSSDVTSFSIEQEGSDISVDQAITVTDLPDPVYGSVTDSRDGKSYKTVTIGDQVWMAENLCYTGSIRHVIEVSGHYEGTDDDRVFVEGGWTYLSNTDQAYCYYDNDSSLGYGCLYTWAAAMDGSSSSADNPSNVKGVCPSGWHLPSDAEWTELETYLIDNGYNYDGSTSGDDVGKSMTSKTGWNFYSGTGVIGNDPSTNNSSGFSALPGGHRDGGTGRFSRGSRSGHWWSSTQFYSDFAHTRFLNDYTQSLYSYSPNYASKDHGLSVRCVKN